MAWWQRRRGQGALVGCQPVHALSEGFQSREDLSRLRAATLCGRICGKVLSWSGGLYWARRARGVVLLGTWSFTSALVATATGVGWLVKRADPWATGTHLPRPMAPLLPGEVTGSTARILDIVQHMGRSKAGGAFSMPIIGAQSRLAKPAMMRVHCSTRTDTLQWPGVCLKQPSRGYTGGVIQNSGKQWRANTPDKPGVLTGS